MNRSITKPVTDASDLKWKAVSVAQSTCSSVVHPLISSQRSFWEAVRSAPSPWAWITKRFITTSATAGFFFSASELRSPQRRERSGLCIACPRNSAMRSISRFSSEREPIALVLQGFVTCSPWWEWVVCWMRSVATCAWFRPMDCLITSGPRIWSHCWMSIGRMACLRKEWVKTVCRKWWTRSWISHSKRAVVEHRLHSSKKRFKTDTGTKEASRTISRPS